MIKTIVGIDPGLHGAVAVLDVNPAGKILSYSVSSLFPKDSQHKTDSETLALTLSAVISGSQCVFIEAQKYVPGQAGIVTTLKNYGVLIGVATIVATPPTVVHPQAWQRAILGRTTSDKRVTKKWAFDFFGKRFNDGMADALAIAVYAARQSLPCAVISYARKENKCVMSST